jgi:flagellar hook assembly protein FlgD
LFVTFTTEPREGPIAIAKPQKSDRKYGIILEKAVVSQSAKISVKTPEQVQITLIIYDNIGNVVFESKSGNNKEIFWNLTNNAGRNVANGTYLIIAEAKGASGKTYKYSVKLGVKR